MRCLVGEALNERVRLDDKPLLTLVVEQPNIYFAICSFAYLGFRGRKELLKVVEDDQVLEPEYIENIFWPDLNTKKNLNALYKRLKQFGSEELDSKLKEIREKMESIVLDISMDFDGELTCEGDIKAEELFKMFDLRFSDEADDGLMRFVKCISISHELLKTSVFCVRGLHQCFCNEQLEQLTKELSYKKINLISIESNAPSEIVASESLLIIDKDLCIIS